MQIRTAASASNQELSLRVSPAHEGGGGRLRAAFEGEFRTKRVGGHERDSLEAAHVVQVQLILHFK